MNHILGEQELSHILSVLPYYHRFKILTEKMEVLLFWFYLVLLILKEKEAKDKRVLRYHSNEAS